VRATDMTAPAAGPAIGVAVPLAPDRVDNDGSALGGQLIEGEMWDPFGDSRGFNVTLTQPARGTGTDAGGGIGVSAAGFSTQSQGDMQADRGRALLQTNPASPEATEVESLICSTGRQEQALDRKAAQLAAAENAAKPSSFDTV
jgi:hypothetical protein